MTRVIKYSFSFIRNKNVALCCKNTCNTYSQRLSSMTRIKREPGPANVCVSHVNNWSLEQTWWWVTLQLLRYYGRCVQLTCIASLNEYTHPPSVDCAVSSRFFLHSKKHVSYRNTCRGRRSFFLSDQTSSSPCIITRPSDDRSPCTTTQSCHSLPLMCDSRYSI